MPLQSTYSGPPRLVVFGGNGFVGSRVCQEGLKTGLAVASVNRSGAPKLDEPWVREVEWVRVSCSCTWGDASCPVLLVIHIDRGTGMQQDTLQPGLWRLLCCLAKLPVQLMQPTLSICSQQTSTPCADTEMVWSTNVQADVFQPEVWRSQLQGGVGVVSCLGAFGSNDFMLKVGAKHAVPEVLFVVPS